jgi:hypothetical protein
MHLTYRLSKLTYKSLFRYSLIVIALLVVAVPVFAMANSNSNALDFSRSAQANNTPQAARQLIKGANVNHLNPGEEDWYTYSRASFDDMNFSWISLALRYESEALIEPEQANFQIFIQEQSASLFQGSTVSAEPVGSGLRSPLKTTHQNLTESFWTGQVAEGEVYYVRVFNQSPFGLNYSLEAKAEQPAVSGATPAGLNAALGGNAEGLNVRQLSWTLTAQAVEDMTAEEAALWMRQAQAVGWIVTAGTSATAAPNPAEADPQLLWRLTAEAIAGQEADAAARWLIQADSLGWLTIPLNVPINPNFDPTADESDGEDGDADSEASLAPAIPVPPEEVYTPVNIYPNDPLEFDFLDINSGRLAPYGEHWYSLLRDDLDDDKIESMALTMFTTPSNGFIDSRVNFEIFPAGQYNIWQRGDADYMQNMGLGQWVSRDEDDHTGERLWKGSLVDGDRYLIKVKNASPEVIDYYLFPDDVENAELGNPTLHQGNSTAGRVPYAPSPPTRPGPPPVPGAGPPEAIPLKMGTTIGKLEAGQEIWYKIFYRDPYNKTKKLQQHDFEILLTNTPLDEIRARHADFALYTGNQLPIWTRGTVDKLEPFGASAPSPYPTEDVRSLQVLWKGQLMEQHVYYLKIWNHDIGPLEYELEVKGGP